MIAIYGSKQNSAALRHTDYYSTIIKLEELDTIDNTDIRGENLSR